MYYISTTFITLTVKYLPCASGETSAGKSSFLNLLFGYEILPTHTVSCTSTITTLRYGVRSHAKVIFGSPETEDTLIEPLDKSGREELYKIVFMRGNERHEGHDVKEVQVFLPLDILKVLFWGMWDFFF